MFYLPFDKNGGKYLQHLPEIANMELVSHDPNLAYGGFPYYFPLIHILKYVSQQGVKSTL